MKNKRKQIQHHHQIKKQKRAGIGSNFLAEDVSDAPMPPPKQHSHKKGKGNFQERQQSIKKMLEKEKHEEEIKSRSAKLVKLKKKYI